MVTHVLVAVDDTPAAFAGARLAIDLARLAGATVDVVAVVPTSGPAQEQDAQRLGRLEQALTAALTHVARAAAEAGVPVRTTLRRGDPASGILDRAREAGADIVVIGRSGRPRPGQPFLGSQTRRVLEFAETPVVVVPEAAMSGSEDR
jgi:nucleotide-binding universal stress UspA family protein